MAAENTEKTEQKSSEPTSETKEDSLSPELLIKHPLQNRWTLWFFKNDKTKEWTENLSEITSFDTVEDFWALYNHIEIASKLTNGCDYCLFKEGIKPMWEDLKNREGGRWLINVTRNQRAKYLDDFWLETLLCLIGETFEDSSEDICGAVVNVRMKGDKIAVWTADAKRPDDVLRVGRKLKEVLQIPQKTIIGFEVHNDTMHKSSSAIKNRLSV